ncbi:tyrosine-protein phosphatase [Marinoscillum sp.]|uniref:tyrosine-protein phosphatase n=1 Tax=Marinoscillum sp. TaxID=2024838 RepID=UPI003BAB9EAD
MLGWFGNKKPISVEVDIHSHLIPGIDDGVKEEQESLKILKTLKTFGYKKVITTPHIHSDYYPNTREIILAGLQELQEAVKREQLGIEVEAAAEYYIDGEFVRLIEEEELLSFGEKRYVLMETPFMNKPLIFDEVVFKLKAGGFIPVLAHPERYTYLTGDLSWLKKIKLQGVLLQVTNSSFMGVYGRQAQKIANQLAKESMIDFVGSDLHRANQLPIFEKSLKQRIVPQILRNNELI